MPELPDLTVYLECVERQALGQRLRRLRLGNAFVLRTVTPRPSEFENLVLIGTSRVGKRLVLRFARLTDGAAHGRLAADIDARKHDDGSTRLAVIHLMRLGRLHWKKPDAALPKGSGLVAFDFERGSLLLTESGSKRRASLHLFDTEAALAEQDRGGLEPLTATLPEFAARLRRENFTLKRALTMPTVLAGIGNAYSDEILHRAQLSPFKQTQSVDDDELRRLYDATQTVLREWTERLRAAAADGWPPKVTAFHPLMAAHGRYGEPCPVCGSKIQRVVYADNEMNYCARCQTGGRLLADRALSRLLHDSWPRTIDEAEA